MKNFTHQQFRPINRNLKRLKKEIPNCSSNSISVGGRSQFDHSHHSDNKKRPAFQIKKKMNKKTVKGDKSHSKTSARGTGNQSNIVFIQQQEATNKTPLQVQKKPIGMRKFQSQLRNYKNDELNNHGGNHQSHMLNNRPGTRRVVVKPTNKLP